MLLVAFLLVNAPNCHLSLVLASVVQGEAVNCNISQGYSIILRKGPYNNIKIFRGPLAPMKLCKCDMSWIILTKIQRYNIIRWHIYIHVYKSGKWI